MPIYEYKCNRCGREIEVFGQTADLASAPTRCDCGQEKSYSRIFSVFAAQSSGSHSEMGECCNPMGNGGGHPCGGACQCGHAH
jgi:putative FmdB family regulatory protein